MTHRRHNLLWLILALTLTLQAVVPSIALAQVSVRCEGSTLTCARVIVPADAASPAHIKCMDMTCCRHMSKMPGCHMSMDMLAGTSPSTSMAQPRCLISVTPVGSTQPASKIALHRSLLVTAPSTAPPSTVAIVIPRPLSTSTARASSSPHRSSHFTRSHALRAPPVA